MDRWMESRRIVGGEKVIWKPLCVGFPTPVLEESPILPLLLELIQRASFRTTPPCTALLFSAFDPKETAASHSISIDSRTEDGCFGLVSNKVEEEAGVPWSHKPTPRKQTRTPSCDLLGFICIVTTTTTTTIIRPHNFPFYIPSNHAASAI